MCVAGSLDGRIFSSGNPTGGTSTWNVVPLQEPKKPNVHVYGISCPSPSLCVAAAYGGKVVTSTDPLGGESAWTTTKLDQIVDLRGISCPTASLCVAVGNEGQVVSSTNPTGGAGAWTSAGAPAGGGSLNGISCPSPSLCVTGNAGQVLTSTSGNGSSWNVVNAGTGLPVEGVSCLSDAACVAVDNNSDVMVSTNPTGGQAAWLFENVISSNEGREGPADGNGMFSLSCASTSLCTAAGANHQVMVSTDPFAPDRPKLPRGRRLRRPHVVITDHPAKRLDPLRGGVKVTFRFHAIGRAAGFQCKLAGRRFRRCKSPARYRVLGGEHSFRVRALSPSGAKGPPAAFHFRVGSLSEPSPAGSCQNPGVTPGRGCINARRR
jgi:hypothetical protein